MAATLNNALTDFRNLVFSFNPDLLKSVNGFNFNRDEFIFTFGDNITNLTLFSKTILALRVNRDIMINIIDTAGTWTMYKYESTIILDTDPEGIWLKSILEYYIDLLTEKLNTDQKATEYAALLDRIANGEV